MSNHPNLNRLLEALSALAADGAIVAGALANPTRERLIDAANAAHRMTSAAFAVSCEMEAFRTLGSVATENHLAASAAPEIPLCRFGPGPDYYVDFPANGGGRA